MCRLVVYVTCFILSLSISCNVMINPSAEINIKQNEIDIESGSGEYDFGQILLGESSSSVTFTIENIGNTKLYLINTPDPIMLSGDVADFSIDQSSTLNTLKVNEFTNFTITFTPKSKGVKTLTVSIANNDLDENPYTFQVIGEGVVPEINVKQGLTDIPSGTGTYDFGNILAGTSSPEVEFTIENTGTYKLELVGSTSLISLIGADASVFSVNQTSTKSTIDPGESTKFIIKFSPTSEGAKSTTVSIANTDPDENPYTFKISGICSVPKFDFNGDGFDDVIIGAYGDDDGGEDSGCAYIFFGKSNLSRNIDASNADVKLIGEDPNDGFFNVGCAGDFNGDGYDDIIVGAYCDDDNGNNAGCAFIFFGSANPPSTIDASNANVKLTGTDGGYYYGDIFGESVSGAGDVNNDGFDDVIVGAFLDDDGGLNSGCAFIFFGSSNPTSLIDASNANVKLVGEYTGDPNYGDIFGQSVSGAGDVNGDGFDDVIVGATYDDDAGTNSGSAFIFFGSSNMPPIIVQSNANIKLVGESTRLCFGYSVSNAGDVNNDGFDDVIVGTEHDKTAYIFLGSSSPSKVIFASNADVKIIGNSNQDWFGYSVSNAGDVNGDGFDDVIVGAAMNSDGEYESGCSFIFFGCSNLSSIVYSSSANVKLIGEDIGDNFGRCVCTAGDINHDGFEDVIIGACWDDDGGESSGCAFIFYGQSTLSSVIDASNANVKIIGEDANDTLYAVSGGK